MKYQIVISPIAEESGGGFFAHVPDLPGCMSDGDTYEQAAKNIQGAILEWLETYSKRGLAPPLPGSAYDAVMKERAELLAALKSYGDMDDRINQLDARLADLVDAVEHMNAQKRFFGEFRMDDPDAPRLPFQTLRS